MSDQEITSNQPQITISSDVEIDDLLLDIAAFDEQIDKFKALKQHRVKSIDEEIARLEEKKEAYRSAIKSFMAQEGEKSLKYPGVGKVNRRTAKGKWNVKDEEGLIKHLKKELSQADLDLVLQLVPKLLKKELNSILDSWEAQDVVPAELVEREPDADSISITFDKGETLESKVKDRRAVHDHREAADQQQLPKAETLDFDTLDF